jgi:hypothetical protein
LTHCRFRETDRFANRRIRPATVLLKLLDDGARRVIEGGWFTGHVLSMPAISPKIKCFRPLMANNQRKPHYIGQ